MIQPDLLKIHETKTVLIICAFQGRNFPLKINTKEKLISFKMFSLLQLSHNVNKNYFLSNVLYFRLIYFYICVRVSSCLRTYFALLCTCHPRESIGYTKKSQNCVTSSIEGGRIWSYHNMYVLYVAYVWGIARLIEGRGRGKVICMIKETKSERAVIPNNLCKRGMLL